MNISLTPELARFVEKEVESGLYQTASEAVRTGLRRLKEDQAARLPQSPKTLEELETSCCKPLTASTGAKALMARKCFADSANG
jgi:putative addiction module CopG family antidote